MPTTPPQHPGQMASGRHSSQRQWPESRPPTPKLVATYVQMGWVGWNASGTTRKNTTLIQPNPRPIGSGLTQPDSPGPVEVGTPTYIADPDLT